MEIPTVGTMTVDLIKGKGIATPRIENPEYIMTVGNARPMEDQDTPVGSGTGS